MVIGSGAEPASIDLGDAMLAPEPTLDGLLVLLVDDDADTREAISAVLKECGAEVSAFACAPEALAALRREIPDVLVSDIAMPGMDGHLLMRRIRELAAERGGASPRSPSRHTLRRRTARWRSWPATRCSCRSRSIPRSSSRWWRSSPASCPAPERIGRRRWSSAPARYGCPPAGRRAGLPGHPLLDQPCDLLLRHAQHLAQHERGVLAKRRRRPAELPRRRLEPQRVALVGRRRPRRVLEPLEEAPDGERRVGMQSERALDDPGRDP